MNDQATSYQRLSESLRIYREAMQQHIKRTLMRADGGAGDWFDQYVLPNLDMPTRGYLESKINQVKQGVVPGAGDVPASLLEEKHFKPIVKRNWDHFERQPDNRSAVLGWMTEIHRARDQWAHPPVPSDEDAARTMALCERVLRPFNSEAANQIATLWRGEETAESAAEPEAPDGESSESEGAAGAAEGASTAGNGSEGPSLGGLEKLRLALQDAQETLTPPQDETSLEDAVAQIRRNLEISDLISDFRLGYDVGEDNGALATFEMSLAVQAFPELLAAAFRRFDGHSIAVNRRGGDWEISADGVSLSFSVDLSEE